MNATLNINYTQPFNTKLGNLKGHVFEVVEQVSGRTTLDIHGRHVDFYLNEFTIHEEDNVVRSITLPTGTVKIIETTAFYSSGDQYEYYWLYDNRTDNNDVHGARYFDKKVNAIKSYKKRIK